MNTNSISLLAVALIAAASGLSAGCSAAPDTTAPPRHGDAADPDEDPELADFSIVGITGGGSGCRSPGAFSAGTSDGGISVRFNEMSLQHQPGGPTLQTVNCNVGVNAHIPRGWKLALSVATTGGNARLPAAAVGKAHTRVSLAGQPREVPSHSELRGPFDGPYSFTGAGSSVIESDCGQDTIVSVGTRITLDTSGAPRESASMSVETVRFEMKLRRCS